MASRPNRWFVLTVVSSAIFVIDMSVLHTALPTLTRELGASASEKLWIVNAYALVAAQTLPGDAARLLISSAHRAFDSAYLAAVVAAGDGRPWRGWSLLNNSHIIWRYYWRREFNVQRLRFTWSFASQCFFGRVGSSGADGSSHRSGHGSTRPTSAIR